ncbi:very short patch repair endonuclease [Paraburkholderia kururiensis]|jgi:DNA mismatch endonuclease (patch repair protein)|uniref:Very short patch repair endonuclease n=1 Tax=Paraburkholderia kururiensis TaxID=984307 RepID=A0ABZ0WI72_9BURK|nr:very short patch repair endonuclease [Paraburkholderia kururiensis]WQD77045.1 very short patch repair endonuclease [Paraburkholderia kururiensis]
MVDVVDAATRSRMMSGIRGRNTKPEMLIRRLLHRRGFRFRLDVRELPGRPDIVLPRYRAAIFVHGCFWHGHDCPLFKWPQTRPTFWREKIARNRANDAKALAALAAQGWRIAIVWECAIRGADRDVDALIERLDAWLRSGAFTLFEARGPRAAEPLRAPR